ncbi:hypothetical protein QPK32_12310 [Massilia sp. YIM B02763]|uniref:hypothetical protein n=1 Tax=Massilia sp. YIM B02763 TaxID=3050130 RepID=UPI0025B67A29|nr:hypothetical protein [Massilia sp. YIM B02763]MDN4053862.1 hypothetical protein [Massilia sp. YIM B02763]
MNKWMAAAMAAMAMASAPTAGAATQSATMEVTFRIQEACAIRSGSAAPGLDAQVSCQYRTPYRIVPNDGAAASSSASSTEPRRAEKPADTGAPAALTVFF